MLLRRPSGVSTCNILRVIGSPIVQIMLQECILLRYLVDDILY